jgi:hypothetical protein
MADKKAKAAPNKTSKGDPHDRIDALVALLKANGVSIPKGLE